MEQNRKIRVFLADRDGFYLQRLKRCLERRGDMEVIGMTDNGAEGLDLIQKLCPDVILMDVLLGERDGFWVLEHLEFMEKKPVIILISAIGSDNLVRRAIFLGADYYMAKPIQGDLLLERIHQIRTEELPKKDALKEYTEPVSVPSEPVYYDPESEVSVLLSRMGISASIKGYHFMRKAILMAIEDQDVLTGITKCLYPDIAKLYRTTASKVERAIRHAIESAWKKNGPQIYFEAAGYLPDGKPTNGQFIAAVSEYFRMEHKRRQKKIS